MVWLLFAFSPLNASKTPGSDGRTEKVLIFGDIRVLSRKTARTILSKIRVRVAVDVPQNPMYAYPRSDSLLETTVEKLNEQNAGLEEKNFSDL